MSSAHELSVVVPIFNEAERVPSLVAAWLPALSAMGIDAALHLYDDGSTDATPEAIARAARGEPRITAHRHDNRGHGPTLARAYGETADSGWILQIDADDVIGPDVFARWWPARHEYDLLTVARIDPARSRLRRALTHMARATVRVRFGPGVHDVNAPYRLMRGAAFADVWRAMAPDTLVPNVLLSGVACRRRLRVLETTVAISGRTRPEPVSAKLRWLRLAVRGGLQLLAPLPDARRD